MNENRAFKAMARTFYKGVFNRLIKPALIKIAAFSLVFLLFIVFAIGSYINNNERSINYYKTISEKLQVENDTLKSTYNLLLEKNKQLTDSVLTRRASIKVIKETKTDTVIIFDDNSRNPYMQYEFSGSSTYFEVRHVLNMRNGNPTDSSSSMFAVRLSPVDLRSMIYVDEDKKLKLYISSSNPYIKFNLTETYIDNDSFNRILKLSERSTYKGKSLEKNIRYFLNPSLHLKDYSKREFDMSIGLRYRSVLLGINRYGLNVGLIFEGKIL